MAKAAILFIGSKGKMLQDTYGLKSAAAPEVAARVGACAQADAGEESRSAWPAVTNRTGSESITGKQKISSPFEFAAKLTEVMLLGVVSLRAGAKIHYDAANMRITNSREGHDLLKRESRRGWSILTPTKSFQPHGNRTFEAALTL